MVMMMLIIIIIIKFRPLTFFPVATKQLRKHAVVQLVEAVCYKPEGCGFDSRRCRWNFSLTYFRPHYGPGFDSASNRNEYQDYFLGTKLACG